MFCKRDYMVKYIWTYPTFRDSWSLICLHIKVLRSPAVKKPDCSPNIFDHLYRQSMKWATFMGANTLGSLSPYNRHWSLSAGYKLMISSLEFWSSQVRSQLTIFICITASGLWEQRISYLLITCSMPCRISFNPPNHSV